MAETDLTAPFRATKPAAPPAAVARPPMKRPPPPAPRRISAAPAGLAALLPAGLSPNALWFLAGAALLLVLIALGAALLAIVRALDGLFIVVAFALWVTSPFIGAAIWKHKEGHFFVGFLWGTMLGPLALLLFLGTPTTMKCLMCASIIPKDARVCGHCRHEQVVPEEAPLRVP